MGQIYVIWKGGPGSKPSSTSAVYVGKTHGSADDRMAQHTAAIEGKTASKLFVEQKIAALLRTQQFQWHVIAGCENVPSSRLNEYEKYYIAQFKTHTDDGGYNETHGG